MKLAFNLVFNHSLISSGCMCVWETVVPPPVLSPFPYQAAFYFLEYMCMGTWGREGHLNIAVSNSSLSFWFRPKEENSHFSLKVSKFFQKQIKPQLATWQYSPFWVKARETVSCNVELGTQKYSLLYTVQMCSFWDVSSGTCANYRHHLHVLLLPKHPSKVFQNQPCVSACVAIAEIVALWTQLKPWISAKNSCTPGLRSKAIALSCSWEDLAQGSHHDVKLSPISQERGSWLLQATLTPLGKGGLMARV